MNQKKSTEIRRLAEKMYENLPKKEKSAFTYREFYKELKKRFRYGPR